MSENTPFGGAGTALADPPAAEEVAEGRRVKPLMVVVAVGVVVALAAAAYFLFFSGGGSGTSGASGVVPHASVSAKPSSKAKPSPAPSAVATAAPVTARDPFAPLVVPVASPAASGVPGAPGGAPSAAPSGGTGTGPTAPAGVTQVVALKAVSSAAGSATLTVNNKSYIAHLGETFATYFQLRGVSANCGYFLYGDMSFQLCGTQSVTLQS
jgi:hypothetical protein